MSTKLHTKSYSNNDRLFFLLNPNEDIAENDPVRVVDAVVESLDLREFKKLYRERGRCPYHPKMMLKIILYAYMNNVYSCRKIERQVQRDIHYIWLASQERPDFVTINRFRNRVKKEINNIFTQVVLLLAERGFITLDVEYIDGTKIEFNLEVGYMEIAKVQSFVKAAVKGGGKINLLKTERLTVSEIQLLCEVGGSHVAFPDMKFEN